MADPYLCFALLNVKDEDLGTELTAGRTEGLVNMTNPVTQGHRVSDRIKVRVRVRVKDSGSQG